MQLRPLPMPYSTREHLLTGAFVVLLLCGSGTAQTKASKITKDTPKPPPPIFEINLSEDSDLGSMPWAKDWPAPTQGDCDGEGNLYVWRWPPGQGLAGLTPKGIVTFLSGQMTDIPTPFARGGFVSESAVYVGVDGIENPSQEDKTVEDAEGHKFTLRGTKGERRRYIARFDKDGTYKGALKLDLPFYVSTFAGFESGTIVAQGLDENKIPRIAMLDSSGQLIRYLQLEKDMSAVSEIPKTEIRYGGSQADAGAIVMTSSFTPSNGKLLFLRSLASQRVYEIQESGEVRAVKIKAPDGYDVEGLIATDKNWLVLFRRPNPNAAWSDAQHSMFEVDPESGELLREYRVKSPDTGVSCFLNSEFWALRYKDGKLTVARGVAEPYRGK
jgi:hypothetical protein